MTILTDAAGRPIERPERPGPDASSAERLAYMRAVAAYNDRIADTANQAFNRAFREARPRHAMNPGEAKAILDVLLPLAPNGHVLDTSELRGDARDAAEAIEGFYLLGVQFGTCAGPAGYCRRKGCKAHVFVLPEGPGFDGRWVILRPGGAP